MLYIMIYFTYEPHIKHKITIGTFKQWRSLLVVNHSCDVRDRGRAVKLNCLPVSCPHRMTRVSLVATQRQVVTRSVFVAESASVSDVRIS